MKTYSEYWRKNRSGLKARELALGLRALRKVAAHIDNGVKSVYWKGMPDATDDSILLDLDMFPDRFPISSENFDFLVGKVVLDGFASVEGTDMVRQDVHKSILTLPSGAAPFLHEFLEAAEQIYIKALTGSSVWSLYLIEFWNRELEVFERDPQLPPSAKSLFHVWKRKALLAQPPELLHPNYEASLKLLEIHTRPLQELAGMLTALERKDKRADFYKRIWWELWEVISQWELFHPELDTAPKSDSPLDGAGDRTQNPDINSLDPTVAEEISWILEEGEVDLSREILSIAQNPAAKPLETFLRKGTVLMDFQPDTAQVTRLRRIFREHVSQVRRARNQSLRRGLLEGKLDPRRLYRVPIDGKTFKSKQASGFDEVWQICIVADASASMTGKGGNMRPWRIAERSFATVIQAAREFRNRIEIYAYFGKSKKCTLTQLYHANRLYTITPYGDTPSGQAIMAAATMLDRKYKKNMIIHITDGAPNSGLPLKDAVSYCENKGIQVFTIGCGCTPFTQQFLKDTFPPGHVYLMKSIDYLAEGLETLFKQRILNQTR